MGLAAAIVSWWAEEGSLPPFMRVFELLGGAFMCIVGIVAVVCAIRREVSRAMVWLGPVDPGDAGGGIPARGMAG